MSVVRTTSWSTIVLQADPEHAREKRLTIEYEFSAPGGGQEPTPARSGTGPIHENGKRVFRANYDQRGPYKDS